MMLCTSTLLTSLNSFLCVQKKKSIYQNKDPFLLQVLNLITPLPSAKLLSKALASPAYFSQVQAAHSLRFPTSKRPEDIISLLLLPNHQISALP